MRGSDPSYAAVCKAAATEQGLDPVEAALRAAGVDVVIEQTGGFCMVAAVYLDAAHEHYIWISEADEDGVYYVNLYSPADDGICIGDGVVLTDVLNLVKDKVRS